MIVMMMAAGAGSRFTEHSDRMTPKPFRIVSGDVAMWKYVAVKTGFQCFQADKRYLVTQKQHASFAHYGYKPHVNDVIGISPMVEQGPAWSVVAATLDIPEDEELLLMDCDSFVAPYGEKLQLSQMLQSRMRRDTVAAVFGVMHEGDEDKNVSRLECHSTLDRTYHLHRVQEGGVKYGDFLNVGSYYFKSVRLFRKLVTRVQKNGEVKLSDLVNVASAHGFVEMVPLDGEFINLGTPELLARYRKQKGYIDAEECIDE